MQLCGLSPVNVGTGAIMDISDLALLGKIDPLHTGFKSADIMI